MDNTINKRRELIHIDEAILNAHQDIDYIITNRNTDKWKLSATLTDILMEYFENLLASLEQLKESGYNAITLNVRLMPDNLIDSSEQQEKVN